jgi:hypothetical protein
MSIGLSGPGYFSEGPQQIAGALIDDRASPSREGHHCWAFWPSM